MSIPGSASPLFFQAAAGAGGYEIERSVRFDSSSSSHLNRTPSSAGNRRTFTFSFWVKRGKLPDADQLRIFNCGPYTAGTGYRSFNISFNGKSLWVWDYLSTYNVTLDSLSFYRDPSAWYHIAVIVDTTQATSTDRVKIYVNGEAVTGFVANTYPSQNYDMAVGVAEEMRIGTRESKTTQFFDGYLADFRYLDGVAASIGDLGEFDDNGVWQPIAYTGTYGTNGFHLDFSDNSSASALGADSSGNGNDWTVNNISPGGVTYSSATNSNTPVYDILIGSTNPLSGTYVWSNAFDASGSTIGLIGPITFINTKPTWSTSAGVEVMAAGNGITATVNGGSQVACTNGGWTTISSGSSGTLDSIWVYGATGSSYFYGVRVDGVEIAVRRQIDDNINSDSLFDSPTNGTQTDTGAGGEVSGNYATLNPLQVNNTANPTFSNGNLEITDTGQSGYNNAFSTIGVSSGKWYVECTNEVGAFNFVGIQQGPVTGGYIGNDANGWSYAAEGYLRHNSSNKAYNSITYGSGDIIGIALDLDSATKTLTFYKNGTSLGTAYSGSELDADVYHFGGTLYTTNDKQVWNFGQRAFAYSAPSGFKALCTANLPDPTIADGSTAMDVTTYTGNNSTQTISGLNFSPDLVWLKRRSGTAHHHLYDIVRGATKRLQSSTTNAESTAVGGVTAFNSDGWTMGNDADINGSSNTFVGWTWDAGTPPTRTHTQPKLYTSTTLYTTAADVVANATARNGGESITSEYVYLVTNSGGRIGEGVFSANGALSGWYMLLREGASWVSYGSYASYEPVLFKWRQDFVPNSSTYTCANNVELHLISSGTSPAPTSFTLPTLATTTDDGAVANTSGSIESRVRANPSAGFSIVTYTGTGSAATVGHGLGVKPAMIHVKRRDTSYDWISTFDNNGQIIRGYLNLTNAFNNESVAYTSSTFQLINSPGDNANNGSFVAYCFAPVEGYSAFGSYTGNGSADGPFIYTGFKSRWIMMKASSTTGSWVMYDTQRDPIGTGENWLYANTNAAEVPAATYAVQVTSNGFKMVGTSAENNGNGNTYIYACFAENSFKTARAR